MTNLPPVQSDDDKRLTTIERLRLYVHDHETFDFTPDDAEELLEEFEAIDRALSSQHSRAEEAVAAATYRAVEQAQDVLAEYIVPDSGISDTECVNSLLGILDHQDLVRAMRASPTSPSATGVRVSDEMVEKASRAVCIRRGVDPDYRQPVSYQSLTGRAQEHRAAPSRTESAEGPTRWEIEAPFVRAALETALAGPTLMETLTDVLADANTSRAVEGKQQELRLDPAYTDGPYYIVDMPINADGNGPEMDPTKVQLTLYEVWNGHYLSLGQWPSRALAQFIADALNRHSLTAERKAGGGTKTTK